LAIATNIAPEYWRNESDADIATALDVLDKQRREVEKRGKRR
jgi:hypothetical protein